ncbi:MAG TPA: zf-HC2 domain-containing protein [Fimbriimonadaceae bacterium]|nr:zf-HC2 domain-containing protein [Fimbriimonadaceae bacterium]
MNCQIAQNLLSSYLDQELTGEQMLEVRSHLSLCNDCSAELEELRAIKHGLASMPSPSPRADLVPRIMVAIGAVEPERPSRRAFGALIATSVAAAVLAFLLFNVFFKPVATKPTADSSPAYDAASDRALTIPELEGHAPLIPVNRFP